MTDTDDCVCCGATAREKHHVVPKSKGGKFTVPICRGCHDMIDRTPLGDWPLKYFSKGYEHLPTEARVLMLKLTACSYHFDIIERAISD
tara:strand:+ start:1277 stop:1543 length:267 start_codon:yes stop_codon:yes gene_type:complete